MNNSESKNWCFTINNYAETDLFSVKEIACKYIIVGKEVAASGTPHLQGYVSFDSNKRFKAVKKLFPHGTHLEKAKGSALQNIAYCSKEDSTAYTSGVPPASKGSGNKIRWDEAKDAAKEGRFEDVPAELQWRFYRTMKEMAKDNMKKPVPLSGPCGLWIYGETGSGKTYAVTTQHPDRYMKPLNKWWDGYQGEDVVHIDEISPEHTKYLADKLKLWADAYPFPAETKGGACQLRPKRIIVTSNYSIDEMGFLTNDYPAIKRRFKEIKKEREQNIIV